MLCGTSFYIYCSRHPALAADFHFLDESGLFRSSFSIDWKHFHFLVLKAFPEVPSHLHLVELHFFWFLSHIYRSNYISCRAATTLVASFVGKALAQANLVK